MAMMRTGRVLLVCALCVLWRGVCAVEVSKADVSENANVFHVPAEVPQPESADRNTGQQESLENVSQERQNAGKPLDPKIEAADDQKRDLKIEKPTADELGGETEEAHKDQIEGGAGREEREDVLEERKVPPDGRGSEGEARQAGNDLSKVGSHSSATTPSGGERPGTSEPSPPGSSLPGASTQEPGAAIPASLQVAPAATMKKNEKTVENPRAEPGKEKLSSEDDVSEQTSQRVNDGVEPSNDLTNEENVSVVLIEQNGESDGNFESTQTRP